MLSNLSTPETPHSEPFLLGNGDVCADFLLASFVSNIHCFPCGVLSKVLHRDPSHTNESLFLLIGLCFFCARLFHS